MNNEREHFRLIQGNEACAEAALDAGLNFFAGYPITPSTEIMEILAKKLPPAGGKVIQMEDEIASISAVLGASLAGSKAMTATSGPGFSLMQENIGFGVVAEIPAVIVNVQRLGPSTGAPTCTAQGDINQARWGSHGDYEIIALSPYSVEECYYLTLKAFNFSERFRTPVILLLEEITGHLRESVLLPRTDKSEIINRTKPEKPLPDDYRPFRADKNMPPSLFNFGEGYRFHVTGLLHDETGFPCTGNPAEMEKLRLRLKEKITAYRDEITLYKEWYTEDADNLIIAYGSPVRSSMAVLKQARAEGLKTGLLALKTIWPFPYSLVEKVCRGKKNICVPEHNFGQIAGEICKCVDNTDRVIPIMQIDGNMIKPEKIYAYLRG